MDDDDNFKGLFFGILFGALVGLGMMYWIEEPFFFTGDMVLIGGVSGGVAGYFRGYEVIEFISHWWLP